MLLANVAVTDCDSVPVVVSVIDAEIEPLVRVASVESVADVDSRMKTGMFVIGLIPIVAQTHWSFGEVNAEGFSVAAFNCLHTDDMLDPFVPPPACVAMSV